GGGTTEVAVISLGGIVLSKSVRTAGDEIDEMILQFARREHGLLIGERTAEHTKLTAGSAHRDVPETKVTLRGRDVVSGLPKSIEVSSAELREAIEPPVAEIVEAVTTTIEETPPELIADIMDQGITLAGGGALLHGLDRRIAEETKMPVMIAEDPLTCVVRGTGYCLEDLDTLRKVFVTANDGRVPR
ncbi:MAG: rod shape-determining protein, partial [Chloroflexota bacterium]